MPATRFGLRGDPGDALEGDAFPREEVFQHRHRPPRLARRIDALRLHQPCAQRDELLAASVHPGAGVLKCVSGGHGLPPGAPAVHSPESASSRPHPPGIMGAEARDRLVAQHHVAVGGDAHRVGLKVFLVRTPAVRVRDHDRPEVERGRLAGGGLATDVGDGAADQHGIDPEPAQDLLEAPGAADEAAEAILVDHRVAGPDLELRPQRVAGRAPGQAFTEALPRLLAQDVVEEVGPPVRRVGSVGGDHPHHVTAPRAQRPPRAG